MKNNAFTYWRDGNYWLGHLHGFPEYLTQGTTFEDLKVHLADLYAELNDFSP